jgi:hypothetical protein
MLVTATLSATTGPWGLGSPPGWFRGPDVAQPEPHSRSSEADCNRHSCPQTFQPHARARLTRLAGGLARGVEPHRGEDFEGRLQRRLDDTGDWTFEWNGRRIACRVHVRVEPDERLREHLRSYWERLVALDYERDIAARRARHTDTVSAQWSAVLKRILDSSEPTGAATMTSEKLATVIREILTDRRAWDEAMDGLEAQDEFARDGFFDPLGEDNRRRPFA